MRHSLAVPQSFPSAKGKEKKYSYTGIFVGIMIAGIGLMMLQIPGKMI